MIMHPIKMCASGVGTVFLTLAMPLVKRRRIILPNTKTKYKTTTAVRDRRRFAFEFSLLYRPCVGITYLFAFTCQPCISLDPGIVIYEVYNYI